MNGRWFLFLVIAFVASSGVVNAEDIPIYGCQELSISGARYILQNDVIATDVCFNVVGNNITLDMRGNSLTNNDQDGEGIIARDINSFSVYNGKIINFSDGIRIRGAREITLTNITVELSQGRGIDLSQVSNSVLSNLILIKNEDTGLSFSGNNNTLTNITSEYNLDYGIGLANSMDLTFADIKSNGNEEGGMYIRSSHNIQLSDLYIESNRRGVDMKAVWNITITGAEFLNNDGRDIEFEAISPSQCTLNLIDVVGAGGRPIIFYNSSNVHIDRSTSASELILCNSDGSLVENVKLEGGGLILTLTDNTVIRNISISRAYRGIYLMNSNNNSISKVSSISNSHSGIYLDDSSKNFIASSIFRDNKYHGLVLSDLNNTIVNTILQSNGATDLYLDISEQDNCGSLTTKNLTGSGNKPILYYSRPTVASRLNASEIILCGADGSSFENISLQNRGNNGFYVFKTNNLKLHRINVQNSEQGISIRDGSANVRITECNLVGNEFAGIFMEGSSNVSLNNCKLGKNRVGVLTYGPEGMAIRNSSMAGSLNEGIYARLHSPSQFIIENSLISENGATGILFEGDEESGMTISHSKISANGGAGIMVEDEILNFTVFDNVIIDNFDSGVYFGEEMIRALVYNNYFNNTRNAFLDSPMQENYWNVALHSGRNIVGGQFIGGNYWANPEGTGFSEICDDEDGNGVCDTPYTLGENNVDYYPLTR